MKNNVMLKVALMMLGMLVAGTGPAISEEKKMSPEMEALKRDIRGANKALDAAKKVGGEWRDARWKKSKAVKVKGKDGKTKKMSVLAAAEAYGKMGDFKKAKKLVKKAIFQADMGYQQAVEQKNAGPTFK